MKTIFTAILSLMFAATQLSGQTTKTVGGTSADYTTLKSAFDAINSGSVTGEIILQVTGNTTEMASAVLNASGTGSANYSGLTIYPTGTGFSISGNLSTALIELNGADNVIIDGRVNASGSTKDLIISNTSTATTATTVRFINSAGQNRVQYCKIRGSETSASTANVTGIICFSTSVSGNGNDGNIIDRNDITSNDGARATHCIFSKGSSGSDNSSNVFSNNNMFNFLNPAYNSCGIHLDSYTSSCTITDNSFYETTDFVPTADNVYSFIQINNNSGVNFTISGNFIGGKEAQCGGASLSKSNAKNNIFFGINLSVGSATSSNVQNNTISKITWSNSEAASFTGIAVANGAVNIGTLSGNTIGAATGTGSVIVTAGATNANVYGISISGSGLLTIQNNTIASVAAANSDSKCATNFYGIYRANTSISNILGNTIGSIATANSIISSSASTEKQQCVYGIFNTTGGTLNAASNTISNLANSVTNSGATSAITGIASVYGINNLSNNTIKDLSIANNNSSSVINITTPNPLVFSSWPSVCGIAVCSSNSLNSITGNTIYNLSNTNAGFAGSIIGLYFGSSGSNQSITRNFIHSISGNSSTASLYGIKINSGSGTYANNIISLGGNNPATIYGFYEPGIASNNNSVYFNTIYIGGSPASGSLNSYAFYSAASANTRNFRNNIFSNARSNTGASGKHYAAYFNYTVSTGLTLDFNDYFASGTGGITGFFNNADVTTLPVVNGLDSRSLSINPQFSNAGGTAAADYKSNSDKLEGIAISTFTTDYAFLSRAPVPTIGAYEGTLDLNIDVYKAGVYIATHSTLKDAFDKINSGVYTGAIQLRIKANTTETASAQLTASGTGSANYSSLTIYPTVANCVILLNSSAPVVDLFGADNVIIDGRVDMSGSTASLEIKNINTGSFASALRFINSAENNSIRYCNLKSSCNSIGVGMVNFTSSTTGNGNDNNTIEFCNITNAGSRPVNAIFSSGTTGRENSGNIIRNNNIFNFFNAGATSFGINLSSNTTNWTISGNSFYDTETISPAGVFKYFPLNLNTGTHTVSNNYIGGSAPQCAGTYWTIASSVAHYFCGIYINGPSVSASEVSNNTIQNISYSSTEDNPWDGIFINSGNVNVTGNTIGAGSGNSSIVIFAPLAAAKATISGGVVTAIELLGGGSGYTVAPLITFSVSGSTSPATATANITNGIVTSISLNSGGAGYSGIPNVVFDAQSNCYSTTHGIIQNSTGIVNISNNIIGSITTTGADYYSHGFESLYVRGVSGTNTITNNLIGSLSTANSIFTSSACATSLIKQDIYGIYSAGTGTTIISGNTVANLSNAYTGLNSLTKSIGIRAIAGSNTIMNNVVRNISTASAQSSGGESASVIGIALSASIAGTTQTVTANTIHSLSNSNASAKVYSTGIFYKGPTSGTHSISGNFIHSLTVSSTDILSVINGIELNSGGLTCSNNIINLGGSVTNGVLINGIWDESGPTNNNSVYFNTVYLSGTVSGTTTSSTAALWNRDNTSVRDYRNNVLSNFRSGGASGKHYAIRIQGTTNLTIDYNDYYSASSMLGRIANSDKADLAAWAAGTSQDLHSLANNPGFTEPGGTNPLDYYTSATLPAVAGTGINTDFDGLSRGSIPKMGALEANNFIWQGGISTDFGTAANWSGGVVPVEGASIGFAANPSNHCLLDQDRSLKNITNAQSTDDLFLNGHQLTLTGNLYFTNGAQIDATSAASKIVFPGVNAQIITSSSFVSNTINALTSANISGVSLSGDLTVEQNLTLNAGNLSIGNNTLYLNGAIVEESGTITGGASSALSFGGSGLSTSLPAITLNNLTINRSGGISLGGDVNVNGTLNLASGILTVGANTLTLSGSSPVSSGGTVDVSNASANLIFNNSAAVTWPATFFTGQVSNLTISGAGGVTAGSNLTVTGVLNLSANNPDQTKGLLEMTKNYGDYSNILTPDNELITRGTKACDILDSYVLTMGPAATHAGNGDVTGRVSRTNIEANTEYFFGSPYTSIMFSSEGTLPTAVTFVITKGSDRGIHSNATAHSINPVQRLYQIIRTGGAEPNRFTLKLRYFDSELNGNNDESKLVLWDHHIPYSSDKTPHEHGKTSQNPDENWVLLSGHGIIYLASEEVIDGFTKYWMINTSGSNDTDINTWLGAAAGTYGYEWGFSSNWSKGSVPNSSSKVIIPATAKAPTLDLASQAATVTIEAGGVMNGGAGTVLTISGGPASNGGVGSWNNSGTFNPESSTVVFDYTEATIDGNTTFNNLTINSGKALTPQAAAIIRIGGIFSNSGTLNSHLFNNTVDYFGDNQSVVSPGGSSSAYYNLNLGGSGTKTMPATAMSILGDFTVEGTASATAGAALSIGGNLSIGAGAVLGTGTFSHQLSGNLTCDGTLSPGSGSIITMNGNAAQTIQGGAVTINLGGLTISNTAGVTLFNHSTSAALNISSGAFTVIAGKSVTASGTTTLGSAQCLILKSDETGTASFMDNGTINGTGTAKIERYITPYDEVPDLKFHFLSSPVGSDQAIENEFMNVSSSAITDFYKWNEPTNEWINFRGSGFNSRNESFGDNFRFVGGKGYLVAYPVAVIKNFTGKPCTSSSGLEVSCSNTSNGGWNLIGNPFPSSLNFDLIAKNSVNPTVYYYDNSVPGYKYYNTTTGGLNGATGNIPPMQGFMVYTPVAGSLTLANDDRTHAGNDIFWKNEFLASNILDLKVEGGTRLDFARICFYEPATLSFDGEFDAYKLFSYSEGATELYSQTNDNIMLAINTLPVSIMQDGKVKVSLKPGTAGNYCLTFDKLNTFPSDIGITLEDKVTGMFQKLNDKPVYNFSSDLMDTPDRFVLHFKNSLSIPEVPSTNNYAISFVDGMIKVQCISDENGSGKVKVFDVTGRLVSKADLSEASPVFIKLGSGAGVYVVSVYSNRGTYSQKIIAY